MRRRRPSNLRGVVLSLALLFVNAAPLAGSESGARADELGAARRVGRAFYENDRFQEAAGQFRRCLELAPDSAVDHYNLALVLVRAQSYPEALELLRRAEQLEPDLLPIHYLRGIIHKRENRFDEAVNSLEIVVSRDPACRGAFYNLGVCHKFQHEYEDSIECFQKAVALDPGEPSSHYQLITLYRRTGDVEKARRHAEIYDRLKDTVDESEKTAEALERSRYSGIIAPLTATGALQPAPPGAVRFQDITAESGLRGPEGAPATRVAVPVTLKREDYDEAAIRSRIVPSLGGAIALGDFDGDQDLDVYVVHCGAGPAASTNRLWRNEGGGRFVDGTEEAGVGDDGQGFDAVFGDIDNDGRLDLYVVNLGPNVLYRQKEDGTFEDISVKARANEPQFGQSSIFVDHDHDNDLDLFVVNYVSHREPPDKETFLFPADFPGEANTLLRNNGNATFSDLTDQAGLLVDFSRSRDALFADFDEDADTDLVVLNSDGPLRFFANARRGRFRPAGEFSPTRPEEATALAEGDFNHDGHADLVVADGRRLTLYTNDGAARFEGSAVPLPTLVDAGISRIRICDPNRDGLEDLLLIPEGREGLRLLAGTGGGRFRDDTAAADIPEVGHLTDVSAGDLDGDGDEDLVLLGRDGRPLLLRNEAEGPGNWLAVRLVGKKVNRSGYGAVVEVAASGHYQKKTYRRGPLYFGLGGTRKIDTLRVTWPNGVAQNVIRPDSRQVLTVEEYVKVSASCAFLYAFNGERFELVNEILGIGPLGVPMGPDACYPVDCTELTRIDGRQLAPRDGKYELRLTEELREITYADMLELRVIDHPQGLEVIPDEKFKLPPFPQDRFFAIGDARPPVSAVDDRGGDVLDLVLEKDGRVPTFPLTQYDGLAETHHLTVDPGDLSDAERVLLFLDGWIYWPDSSVTMAVSQDPRFRIVPLTLKVRDAGGAWKTVRDWVGLPTSKGLTVPLDLTGCFTGGEHTVRLETNLCVYFDRIFFSTRDEASRCRETKLPVACADLRYRGFSRMRRDRLGFERFDYADVAPTGSWNPPQGRFTRYGVVTPLLNEVDDRYVIFGPGDELRLTFDASGLPGLPEGWARDFILYANGWVKDGDLNTNLSDTVEPLPFHGMSAYPYPDDEHYPDTAAHRRYLRQWNTRPAGFTVGRMAPRVGPARP